MTIIFAPQAKADLEDIGDYITRRSPARAASFIEELLEQAAKIAHAPTAYPTRTDLGAVFGR